MLQPNFYFNVDIFVDPALLRVETDKLKYVKLYTVTVLLITHAAYVKLTPTHHQSRSRNSRIFSTLIEMCSITQINFSSWYVTQNLNSWFHAAKNVVPLSNI